MESEVVIVIPPNARVAELEKELALKTKQVRDYERWLTKAEHELRRVKEQRNKYELQEVFLRREITTLKADIGRMGISKNDFTYSLNWMSHLYETAKDIIYSNMSLSGDVKLLDILKELRDTAAVSLKNQLIDGTELKN